MLDHKAIEYELECPAEAERPIAAFLVEDPTPLRCWVDHPDAGGRCERPARVAVYGLLYCRDHGAEARIGALTEFKGDAAAFLERLDNTSVVPINTLALEVIRSGANKLAAGINEVERSETDAIRRAYPVLAERVDEQTKGFAYHPYKPRNTPVDWWAAARHTIHKLMRIAYEQHQDRLVEALEEHREHAAAQLSFALDDYERRVGEPTANK